MAINIPLAVLFAFAMLFMRGQSANLLSIGAVYFGIIVDSSVIMVENIFRHINANDFTDLPLKERILLACRRDPAQPLFSPVDHGLRVLAAVHDAGPRRTDLGTHGRNLRLCPGGALLLAVTLSPVLCSGFLKNLKPSPTTSWSAGLQRATCGNWAVRRTLVDAGRLWRLVAVTLAAMPLRPGVHAGVGRGQCLDPRHLPVNVVVG